MRVLVFGSDGFVGRNVIEALSQDHEVLAATVGEAGPDRYHVDLTQPDTITAALNEAKPEAIISCAGIVENSEKANLNVIFTTNILDAVLASGLKPSRIIICGSAAEYGVVDSQNLPVSEDAPRYANSPYGLAKLKEVDTALEYREKHSLPIVVVRMFNPIGAGMHERMMIPRMLTQIAEIRDGKREGLEVSRLDSKRDYISIKDVASAFKVLLEHEPKATVYNLGSGQATSNQDLIELMLGVVGVTDKPKITESSKEPEALVAIQADISRLKTEFGWKPKHSLEDTMKEILRAKRQ